MVKIGTIVFEKMLMDDVRWMTHDRHCTTDVARRQPIATGHLSNSGDINIKSAWKNRFELTHYGMRFKQVHHE